MKRTLLLIIVLAVGGFFLYKYFNSTDLSDTNGQDQQIIIGVVAPLSGDSAPFGFGMRKGITLAKKELRASNYRVIYEDGGCNADVTKKAVQKLIDQGAVAVIGEACSSATTAAIPVVTEAKVVLISPASTAPSLTLEGGDYFFRTVPNDTLQGSFISDVIKKDGNRKLAILYSTGPYGEGFKDVLVESFTAGGGEVAMVIGLDKTNFDLTSLVQDVKTAAPDAVMIVSNSPTSAGAIMLEMQEAGLSVNIYGSEALKEDLLISDIKGASEGLKVSSVSLGTVAFRQRFSAEYGEEAVLFSAQTYDAFKALYLAANKVEGDVTGEALQEVLNDITFSGASGEIKFDEYGDLQGEYDIYTVVDGAFRNTSD